MEPLEEWFEPSHRFEPSGVRVRSAPESQAPAEHSIAEMFAGAFADDLILKLERWFPCVPFSQMQPWPTAGQKLSINIWTNGA
jgi:hypothetical protein